jgi:hypothetical protein
MQAMLIVGACLLFVASLKERACEILLLPGQQSGQRALRGRSMGKFSSFAAIGLALFFTVARPAAADPGLTVTLGAHTVTVSGLSPGSSGVFFAVLHEPIPART